MELRRLGSQGPDISVIGYGAWEIGGDAYGPNPETSQVINAIHSALDSGMNWIDTAEVYGSGKSEELVGKAIKGRREHVLIATKVAPNPGGTGYEPSNVKKAAKASLGRLNTDHIDLFQLHWKPSETWPIEDTWGAMSDLQDEGLVRFIGVSNFTQQQIERCLAVKHCDSLQPQFSMFHREEEELISWCGRKGIGVVAYGPLAYGLLSGKMDPTTTFDPNDWRSGKNPNHPYYVELFAPGRFDKHLELVEKLKPIAETREVSVGQLALAWTIARSGMTSAITGSRNADHCRENALAGSIQLTEQEKAAIDSVLG